jgi:hypothetical protein
MISIRRLAVDTLDGYEPGRLLLPTHDLDQPSITFTADMNGTTHKCRLLLAEGYPSTAADELKPYLSVDRWELIPDWTSRYAGSVGGIAPGDAFISADQPGIVTSFIRVGTLYVSLDGVSLPEPEWTYGFLGFRSWKIIVRGVAGEEPVVVHERRRERRNQG